MKKGAEEQRSKGAKEGAADAQSAAGFAPTPGVRLRANAAPRLLPSIAPLLLGSCLPLLLCSFTVPNRAPVLVELFTSEGCSSCPPADRLLEVLDSQVVVLGEHVDYWDHQGWRDPWSSHALTQRQETYAFRFRRDGPYTPQMVVDGSVEFNGSDNRRAADEIARARAREKTAVRLTRSGSKIAVEIEPAAHAVQV